MLNKLSFAKSVVGRAVMFVGGENLLPLNFPLMMRIPICKSKENRRFSYSIKQVFVFLFF